MLSLASLLDRFKHVGFEQLRVKEETVLVLKEICGIQVVASQVTYKDHKVTLQISHIAKNAVHVKKSEILAEINRRLPKAKVVDVH